MSMIYEDIQYERCPNQQLVGGIQRWVEHRQEAGGFLMAVFRNDLTEAVLRADSENIHILRQLITWMWANLPHSCWGSQLKVDAWKAPTRNQ